MSHEFVRVENAYKLLEEYNGDIPLDNYLRSVFKENKNWGSKDRKAYREICFRYFRWFSRTKLSKEIVAEIYASLNGAKVQSNYNPYDSLDIELGVGKVDLGIWFRRRPPVFITGAKTALTSLREELKKNEVEYVDHNFYIESKTQLSEAHYPVLNKLQIMDRGSIEACLNLDITDKDTVWDACAGAGGKTLAIGRMYSPQRIVSSDIRKKSLSNLQKRARLLNQFAVTKHIDASTDIVDFDPSVVIIDAPCSGSGTWRRNPDRAFYFKEPSLEKFVAKQQAILTNIANQASQGCKIVYITCSVFKKENEAQVLLAKQLGLELIKSEMLGGLNANADYLFRAQFRKI